MVERVQCPTSDVVRLFAADGTTIRAEHADLNRDGKVDRYTSQTEEVAQYVDTKFDGAIDVVVERVDALDDLSMEGYEETFSRSNFLYRVRADRNRDGRLDFEKLTARGLLPKTAR